MKSKGSRCGAMLALFSLLSSPSGFGQDPEAASLLPEGEAAQEFTKEDETPSWTDTLGRAKWELGFLTAGYFAWAYRAHRQAVMHRESARIALENYYQSFPEGLPQDPRLQKHLDRLAALEEALSEEIRQIPDPVVKKQTLGRFGAEVCAKHFRGLTRAKEAVRRKWGKFTRPWRKKPALIAPVAPAPIDGSAEAQDQSEAVLQKIHEDEVAIRQTYQELYEDLAALKPEIERVTGREFNLPAKLEDLPQLSADTVDHRALRDSLDDVMGYLKTQHQNRLDAASTKTVLEKLWEIRKSITLGNAWNVTKQGVGAAGNAILHPIKTAGSALVSAPGAALKYAPEEFYLLTALTLVAYTKSLQDQLHEDQVALGNERIQFLRQKETQGPVWNNDALFIVSMVHAWREVSRAGLSVPENFAFLKGETANTTKAALANLKSLKTEAMPLAQTLKLSPYEALWLLVYRQAEDGGGLEIEKEKTDLKALYERNQQSIQTLALETEDFPQKMEAIVDQEETP